MATKAAGILGSRRKSIARGPLGREGVGVRGRLLPLSSALLRPHVESGVQFWAPQDNIRTDGVERGLQRATKRRKALEQLSCQERLSELGLFSLGRRRRRQAGGSQQALLCLCNRPLPSTA